MIKKEFSTCSLPPIDTKEVLRYLKAKTLDGLPLKECLDELGNIDGNLVFAEFDIEISGDETDLGFYKVKSKDLIKTLKNSDRIIVFAATIGAKIDRLIAKYSKISPIKAVTFQAIGAERIEALCDAFSNDIRKKYNAATPRFSPGYGDLSLEVQRSIIDTLDGGKLLGITLTDSLLMMPSKSVTAIIGYSSK